MILNQTQAEAVYSAMCALNNIGGTASDIDADEFQLRIRCGAIVISSASDSFDVPVQRETYINQSAFAAAYGLN